MLPFKVDLLQLTADIYLRQGAAAPTAGAGVVAPVGSFYYQSGTSVLWQKVAAPDTAWVSLKPTGWWGDASDGNVTINSNTTLSRDMHYDVLTVSSAVRLVTANWRIYANRVVCDGAIVNNGANAAAATAGGASAGGSWGGATASSGGGNGGVINGTSGGAITTAVGFTSGGGAGGAGSSGVGAGGGGLTTTVNILTFGAMLAAKGIAANLNWQSVQFASGGGGGGGNGAQAGGGGGGGAGSVFVCAREIVGIGTMGAIGGTGADGTATGCGGGGGGGGGFICTVSELMSLATDVSGGAGGASGGGAGAAGSNGGAGTVLNFPM